MYITGIGRFIFWEGGSLWIGRAVAGVELHAHHAIQLGLGFSGPVEFRQTASGPWRSYAGALIPSNLPHLFQAPGRKVANIFIEPETEIGRRLLVRHGKTRIAELDDDLAAELAAPLEEAYDDGAEDEVLAAISRETFARLAGTSATERPTDPRVVGAIEEISRRLEEALALDEIAEAVGLSDSRLRHLFVEETGISFRAYVLWARLNRALQLGFNGTSWTEAAHAAHFADSAHLTRTCRRMLGLTPTSLRAEGSVSALSVA